MITLLLATALAQSPAEAQEAPAAPKATVSFEAAAPHTQIAVVEARPALPRGRTGLITRILCVAPCTAELEPGSWEFLASAPGQKVRPQRFEVPGGGLALTVQRSPVRTTGIAMVGAGIVLASAGAVVVGQSGVSSGVGGVGFGAYYAGITSAVIGVPLVALGKGRWKSR